MFVEIALLAEVYYYCVIHKKMLASSKPENKILSILCYAKILTMSRYS